MIKPEDAQIGNWYYYCCELDLYEIMDADDLEEARSFDMYKIFATEDEALANLK